MDDPSPADLDLSLDNPCGYAEVRRRELRPWLRELVEELAPEATSFAVRFTSDREMRRLNGTYRGKDEPTDVLSFPGNPQRTWSGRGRPLPLEGQGVGGTGVRQKAGEGVGRGAAARFARGGEQHLGDVVIAVPTARRQAAERGHAVERELRTLLLHGVLHCLGYDHETDDGTMERLERRLRRQWLRRNRLRRNRVH